MLPARRRINRAIAELRAPAQLVTGAADLFYLTGTGMDGFSLLLTPAGAVIFTVPMLKEQMQAQVPGVRVVAGSGMPALVAEFCRKKGIAAVAVDPGTITYAFAQQLRVKLKLVKAGDGLAQARLIKDADELARIREACRIAARTVERVRRSLRPGMTEDEIVFKIEEYFAKQGVRSSFPAIVASGPNSSQPHHQNSPRRLAQNDIVTIDLGCIYQGYCSDLTRTFLLGKMNHLKEKVYALVAAAKLRATEAIRPGVAASCIDAAARHVIAAGGYGAQFIHTTGHGVGIEVHEAPRLSARDTTVLKPGMVITVEPGIYLSGRFGVRLEDTVLVTEKGYEVLTA